MKRFLVITLALVAGALATSAQDGNPSELLREIDRLTERLRKRADAADKVRSIDAVPVLRIYDVGDLCARVENRVLRFPNVLPTGYDEPELREIEPRAAVEVDQLIEMIRLGVEPDSWDTIESASIEPKNDRLFVHTLPRVHRGIERMLAWRREAVQKVAVQIVAVAVGANDVARLANERHALPPALANELQARGVLGSVSFSGRSGQEFAGRNGRTIRYVRGYDPEIAQAAKIGDPQVQELFLGLAAEVIACVDKSSGGAVVHARISMTSMDGDIPVHETEHGPLELPRMKLTRSASAFWVPLGRTVIVGGGTADGRNVVFLLTVRAR